MCLGRVNNVDRKLENRPTGGVNKKTCCAWIDAEPDMSLGTVKLKFSNELSEPIMPWDWNFPMKRISPRSADAAGQVDPQATMPITRLISSCPANTL